MWYRGPTVTPSLSTNNTVNIRVSAVYNGFGNCQRHQNVYCFVYLKFLYDNHSAHTFIATIIRVLCNCLWVILSCQHIYHPDHHNHTGMINRWRVMAFFFTRYHQHPALIQPCFKTLSDAAVGVLHPCLCVVVM